MNLDELRSVRRTERQKDSLQHLRDSYYEDVADYIARQKAERKRAADRADDPFSDPEVGRLTDEIETAEDVVEAIYERRVGKVVKLASFAAADMSADTNGLTAEEQDLFDDLVSRIKENRRTVLDVLAGKRSGAASPSDASPSDPVGPAGEGTGAAADSPPAKPSDDAPPTPPDADPDAPTEGSGDVLADAMGGGSDDGQGANADADADAEARDDPAASETAPADAEGTDPEPPRDAPEAPPESQPAGRTDAGTDRPETEATAVAEGATEAGGDGADDAQDDTDRVTLRITRDVGQIFGVDEREYDLAAEDVVTLPTTNADPLVERGAAERLD